MTDYHEKSAAFVINDIITQIVKGGHPKARRLAEDYNSERKGLMETNPNMPLGLTVVEALRGLLEQAYGIQFYASVADMLENVAEHGMSREDAHAVISVADLIRDGNVAISGPNIGNDN
ncbi:hypothetical protein GGQ73_000024 [Rhizobium skierniewicense]|uniref:Uncharacterized protein n=1 Tax=Rhizobium skierniewicense TaxID=984260 RepID=A0A7W6CBC3_9HYPH|nr:hypothetical protein [Rhizobium skierniewicense]MBB3944101.1 hypothetical protein [Rhizobium skierniewicense]